MLLQDQVLRVGICSNALELHPKRASTLQALGCGHWGYLKVFLPFSHPLSPSLCLGNLL